MIKCAARFFFAVILGFTLAGAACAQPSCVVNCILSFDQAYSNSDGSVQFLVFSPGDCGRPLHLAGLTLVASSDPIEHRFEFPSDLPKALSCYVLVGTQGFADLDLVKPDFVVPNGFLFVRNGTIDVRPGSWALGAVSYEELPTDGVSSLQMSCDDSGLYCSPVTGPAWAVNRADEYYNFWVTVPITPAFTGSWFDPAQSGHGLHIEILSDNRLLAAWFTFNPAGTEQAWFVGVGTYSAYYDNTATVTSAEQPTGGRWIPNFDPSRVVNNGWGTLTFNFFDCNHGKVEFFSPDYGTGSMNLTRLTQPAGLSC